MFDMLPCPGQVGSGHIDLCPVFGGIAQCLVKTCLIWTGVDLEEEIAGFNVITLLEVNFRSTARRLEQSHLQPSKA